MHEMGAEGFRVQGRGGGGVEYLEGRGGWLEYLSGRGRARKGRGGEGGAWLEGGR